ncbi:Cof-type HAD-IIB family hydrolase [Peribacillus kribbensis]|uniref:Cof-type HAD-IIB family hydrolase n=1 Tax=Peribacillus kribbensis TaxID=356658 RepID=UPI00041C7C05|nr:Cof-type HAD-IIB family hydrolase [Peribacillus kribbensis]
MKEQHLIALDLDGTLLRNNKTISERTKSVLASLMNLGHKIMISTGRPYRSSEQYYRELGLNTPIVNFNGAFVHHPLDSKWGAYHSPMDIKIAKDIVEALHAFNFHNVIAEVRDDVYFHYHDEKLLDIFNLGKPQVTTGDIRNFLKEDPTSLLIHTDEAHVPLIRGHLEEVHAEVIEHRRWADPFHIIEIVKKGMNKAVGIKRVADYFQIPKERIIAFGDEDNDLEMLEYAGCGVAMGNGIELVKNIANEVTLTNEEDGIALFLEERFKVISA